MANRFCVSLTSAKNDTDKATVAFVVANAAVGSGKETMVFLSIEGVRLAQRGFADQAHFTRMFRSAYGVTPGRYARLHAAGAG